MYASASWMGPASSDSIARRPNPTPATTCWKTLERLHWVGPLCMRVNSSSFVRSPCVLFCLARCLVLPVLLVRFCSLSRSFCFARSLARSVLLAPLFFVFCSFCFARYLVLPLFLAPMLLAVFLFCSLPCSFCITRCLVLHVLLVLFCSLPCSSSFARCLVLPFLLTAFFFPFSSLPCSFFCSLPC